MLQIPSWNTKSTCHVLRAMQVFLPPGPGVPMMKRGVESQDGSWAVATVIPVREGEGKEDDEE